MVCKVKNCNKKWVHHCSIKVIPPEAPILPSQSLVAATERWGVYNELWWPEWKHRSLSEVSRRELTWHLMGIWIWSDSAYSNQYHKE